jgi:putative endonuclease
MSENLTFGTWGEREAESYLIGQGFEILARNYRSRYGEIDLVARKGSLIACVEVKTRRTSYFPIALVVTPQKQKKIVTTAKIFLSEHKLSNVVCRFDVATIEKGDHGVALITYLENAFYGG